MHAVRPTIFNGCFHLYITDVSLAEYIRRRKLTAAAFELQSSDRKVIDIAMKYGYDSATSFARAFSAIHGMNPTEARQSGIMLKAYPKISFQISIQKRFYSEWLPVANYKCADAANFEIYGGDEEFGYLELWFPINKK